jgi:hypothetical protein
MRQNATRMAVERIQALAATAPAASAPTVLYAHHKAKEPQMDGDGPHGREKTNAQNGQHSHGGTEHRSHHTARIGARGFKVLNVKQKEARYERKRNEKA